MQPQERHRGRGATLLLAAVVALAVLQTRDLRELVLATAQTRGALASEADFYAAPPLLGPEAPILQWIASELAPGTAVAVRGSGAFEERRQRFWLALLPEHPIADDAAWIVCPAPCGGAGDEVVARGRDFVLLRRAGAERP